MKRVTLVVLAGLLCAATLTAQARPPRTQTGNATQEMQTPGLSAGHNSLPIGSKAKVRSLSNGREIEVTITETIPTSTRRIIDLSPSAAMALELGFGGPVIVTPLGSLQAQPDAPPPAPVPQPAPQIVAPSPPPPQPQQIPSIAAAEPELPGYLPEYQPEPLFDLSPEPVAAVTPPPPPPEPEPVPEWDVKPEPVRPPPAPVAPSAPSSPYTIINHYYIMSTEDFQRLQRSGALPFDSGSGGAMPYQDLSQRTGPGTPPVTYSTYTAPPVNNVQIIPALPSPHSGKIYRLLVDTYPNIDTAFNVFNQLKKAGFEAVMEQAGVMCRVYAVGIPAPSVFYAAQRLGAIGFEKVWVQE